MTVIIYDENKVNLCVGLCFIWKTENPIHIIYLNGLRIVLKYSIILAHNNSVTQESVALFDYYKWDLLWI